MARLDLGGMGPLVVRVLDLRRMTLMKKDVSEYVGVAIPLYERWTHRHEFLTRGQRRAETVEEYFKAKRELLMEGDSYGNMIAAYPAYWSGLRRLELVILMDARVLGCIWPGQIMGRDPQKEEWAADTAPDVETLQKLLSNLEDQRAVWPRIQAFLGRGSRGQREEKDTSQNPPRVTESEGEGDLGPAADHGQGPAPPLSWQFLTNRWRRCNQGERSKAA